MRHWEDSVTGLKDIILPVVIPIVEHLPMKHLPKHLQPRYRYLAVEFTLAHERSVTREEFQKACWVSARQLLGDTGSANCGLQVVKFTFNNEHGKAIVRVRRNTESKARAAIACIAKISDTPVFIFIRGTSGTVRSCEEKYLHGPSL